MSQSKLARMLGVTLGEVERRIEAIRAHCAKLNLPCPLIERKDNRGNTIYHVTPTFRAIVSARQGN